jgi:hypothetical protein
MSDDQAPPRAAPTVSIIIPAYNASGLLEAAIASIAAQTLREIEVILVDDASSDDTAAQARTLLARHGLAHEVIRLAANAGPAAARNRGVAAARGTYVAFLDADDEWLPDKLRLQVALMEANPKVTLCGCQADWVDGSGTVIGPLYQDLPALLPDGWKLLLWNCYVATPCAMARRRDLGTEPFDPRLRIGEDRDLWIKLASNGVVGLVPEKLVNIRVSPASYMSRHTALLTQYTKPMLEKHLGAFADTLSLRERMRAIGSLHSQIGKGLSGAAGQYLKSCRHLLMAALLGFRPMDSLRHLLFTSPLVSPLKRYVKRVLAG